MLSHRVQGLNSGNLILIQYFKIYSQYSNFSDHPNLFLYSIFSNLGSWIASLYSGTIPLSCMALIFFKGTGTWFYKMSLNLGSSICQLHDSGFAFLEQQHRSAVSFPGHHTWVVPDTSLSHLGNVQFDNLFKVVSNRFLHCKGTSPALR